MNQSAKTLLDEVRSIKEEFTPDIASGESFNIFSILQVESREVKTHSRFLAELLNIHGSHGQGDLFLKAFLKYFGISEYDTSSSRVEIEYYLGPINTDTHIGGRIDILLKDQQNHSILIENKIYAPEQSHQLLRYYNSISGPKHIFFLTLYGEPSKYHKEFDNYRSISYSTDIIDWLEICQEHCKFKPLVYTILSHYVKLVKKLTQQNNSRIMNKKIAETIVDNDSFFSSYITLAGLGDAVYAAVLQKHVFPTLKEVAKKNELQLRINESDFKEKNGSWLGFSFHNALLNKLNLCIAFQFDNEHKLVDLIYGFRYIQHEEKLDSNAEKQRKALQEKMKEGFSDASFDSNYWLCHAPFHEYRNWELNKTLYKLTKKEFKHEISRKTEVLLSLLPGRH